MVGLFSTGSTMLLVHSTIAAYTITWLTAVIVVYWYQTEKRLAGKFATLPEEQLR